MTPHDPADPRGAPLVRRAPDRAELRVTAGHLISRATEMNLLHISSAPLPRSLERLEELTVPALWPVSYQPAMTSSAAGKVIQHSESRRWTELLGTAGLAIDQEPIENVISDRAYQAALTLWRLGPRARASLRDLQALPLASAALRRMASAALPRGLSDLQILALLSGAGSWTIRWEHHRSARRDDQAESSPSLILAQERSEHARRNRAYDSERSGRSRPESEWSAPLVSVPLCPESLNSALEQATRTLHPRARAAALHWAELCRPSPLQAHYLTHRRALEALSDSEISADAVRRQLAVAWPNGLTRPPHRWSDGGLWRVLSAGEAGRVPPLAPRAADTQRPSLDERIEQLPESLKKAAATLRDNTSDRQVKEKLLALHAQSEVSPHAGRSLMALPAEQARALGLKSASALSLTVEDLVRAAELLDELIRSQQGDREASQAWHSVSDEERHRETEERNRRPDPLPPLETELTLPPAFKSELRAQLLQSFGLSVSTMSAPSSMSLHASALERQRWLAQTLFGARVDLLELMRKLRIQAKREAEQSPELSPETPRYDAMMAAAGALMGWWFPEEPDFDDTDFGGADLGGPDFGGPDPNEPDTGAP